MDHQVPASQDLVALIVIPRLEPEGLVERARAADILRWEDRFRSFSSHGDLLLMLVRWRTACPSEKLDRVLSRLLLRAVTSSRAQRASASHSRPPRRGNSRQF